MGAVMAGGQDGGGGLGVYLAQAVGHNLQRVSWHRIRNLTGYSRKR